ncbi:hypothetical protein [Streptomyces sp. NPDC101206]|uniref:hypothetical protein n=1 Tax=Streptomyces sp. NPDC101206 TaxID=3366128 RepID=UPI00380A88FC
MFERIQEAREERMQAKIDATPYGKAMKELYAQARANPAMTFEEFRARLDEVSKLQTQKDIQLQRRQNQYYERRSPGANIG